MPVHPDDMGGPIPPKQSRDDRPNPRWPQSAEIEALVARARSVIAKNPHALVDLPSPVATIVEELTDDDYEAARVVEGVLADKACRFMLAGIGLHGGGSTRRGRAQR